ncbi:MAG: glycosyltransferase family 2 protein [Verrucomicrobiaceae bacterium]|nr:MAG: glycosyltransferase family 2 protein [Verrucomicrobiaceae bacterium]
MAVVSSEVVTEHPTPAQTASKSAVEPAGVSVVIPAFNYAAFLPHAIDSVLAQGYSSLEVLIIDDGSTDATREITSKYTSDPRVRYVWQENAGLSAARNTGIREARFPYIGFLDAESPAFSCQT